MPFYTEHIFHFALTGCTVPDTRYQMHRLFRVPYYALNLALIIRLAESIAVNVTVSVVPSAETAKARETPVGEAEAIPTSRYRG